MTTLYIVVASFLGAFLGCFQAINVVKRRVWLAFFTSAAIGVSQLTLFKLVPNITATSDGILYVLAGLVGSHLSMHIKRHES